MARETNAMVTAGDVIYMLTEEGYVSAGTWSHPTDKLMTKADLLEALKLDESLITSYASNQLVPYHLLAPAEVMDTTPPVFLYNGFNSGMYISDEGDNYLTCHWKVTDNVAVDYHRVYYRVVGTSTWNYKTVSTVATENNYQLTGLTPYTEYEVYVRTYDTSGNYTNSSSYTRSTTGTPSLILSESLIEVSSTAKTIPNAFTITTNTSWSITDNQSWLSVSPTSGSGNTSVNVTVTENTSIFNDRTATITVNAGGLTKTVTFRQLAKVDSQAPSIGTLSLVDYDYDSIEVSWTAASDAAGIAEYRVYYKRSYDSTYNYITYSNTVRGATLNNLFDGTTYTLYLRAKDNNGNWSGNSNTITVNLPVELLYPSFNISSGYSTASAAANASTTPNTKYYSGSGTPVAFDIVYNDVNGNTVFNGQNLWYKFGNYVGQIASNGAITMVYDYTQTLSLNMSSRTVNSSSGSFTFSVTSNTTWVVSDNASWITISGASGSGNDSSITVSYTTNSGASRNGTITVRTTDNYITKTIAVTQNAAIQLFATQMATSTSSNACNLTRNLTMYHNGGSAMLINFGAATVLYSDSFGNNLANAGHYSDGAVNRYWNGIAFTSTTQCGFGGI